MIWLGMCALGVFIGAVITFGLRKIEDWKRPGNVFSAIISSAIAGGVFTFIRYLSIDPVAVALYPVGLAYGMLCLGLQWLSEPDAGGFIRVVKVAHGIAFAAATALLLAIFLSSDFRSILPR